jgi:FkbM family methyltransferase
VTQITVSAYGSAPSQPDSELRCAVITPVGPGHELLAEDSVESVGAAYDHAPGRFTGVDVIRIDDTQGALGRSEARNLGVTEAGRRGAQWIFFLDSDDLMHPSAFVSVAPYLDEWDAIWGAICELAEDEDGGVIRPGQVMQIHGITELLVRDPWLTLQMGHFVRTPVALDNPFDRNLNCGEDFDYYVRLWSDRRCTKLPVPLFYNRRGLHSGGPRSATGKDWLQAVTSLLASECAARGMQARFTLDGETFAFFVANPFDMVQRHFLAGRFFEHEELQALRAIVRPGATLVEVGANVGNHVVFYARFLRPRKIIVLEPLDAAARELRRNLELNGVNCADLAYLGLAAGGARRRYKAVTRDPNNLGATLLIAADDGTIESIPLSELVSEPVDFIKIDVEGMEMEVLEGAADLIQRQRPTLMVEVVNNTLAAFEAWRKAAGYEVVRRFPYVHAVNFILAPARHDVR